MPSKGNKHRGIRMEDDLWTQFQAATKQAGTNPSETIRQLIQDWLNNNEGERDGKHATVSDDT